MSDQTHTPDELLEMHTAAMEAISNMRREIDLATLVLNFHALGLEHSADSQAVIAAVLTINRNAGAAMDLVEKIVNIQKTAGDEVQKEQGK